MSAHWTPASVQVSATAIDKRSRRSIPTYSSRAVLTLTGANLIKSKNLSTRRAVNDSIDPAIHLPDDVVLLREEITVFNQASRVVKRQCAWHLRCLGSASYERFRQQQIFTAGQFDLSFSLMAERAYSALFKLSLDELPHCTPGRVIAIKHLATDLLQAMPTPQLLPGHAKNPSFLKGLSDLCDWRPSALPVGVSARGNQIRRWMIKKIAEEFIYTFAQNPPVGVVGDILRFGWPTVTNRTVRRMMTEDLMAELAETVKTRRKNDPLATAVDAYHRIGQAATNASPEFSATRPLESALPKGDIAILAEIERLAAALNDDYSRKRLLASLCATRDERGYLDAEPDQGY